MAKQRHTTLLRRIIVPILSVMLLQTGLVYGAIFLGGLINQLEANAFSILEERVISRTSSMEMSMVQNWSNVGSARASLEKMVDASRTAALEQDPEAGWDVPAELLTRTGESLIFLMRRNGVTGAFLVLEQGNGGHAGLYLRDLEPLSNPSDSSDLLVERGPAAVAQELGIPFNYTWKATFELDPDDPEDAFYYRPAQAAEDHPELGYRDLGYWSHPFRLNPDMELNRVITYTVPLRGADGSFLGVLGVEISEEYLRKQLPANELGTAGTGGFLLCVGEEEQLARQGDHWVETGLSSGALIGRAVGDSDRLTFSPIQTQRGFYQFTGNDGATYMGKYLPLTLYNSHTPFSNEQWVLAGFVESGSLLAFPNQFKRLMTFTAVAALLLGAVIVFLVAKLISRPVAQLSRQLQLVDPSQPIRLEEIGIEEIDEVSRALEELSRQVVQSASRMSKIFTMAGVGIGAFEYNQTLDRLFCTDQFLRMLQIDTEENAGQSASFIAPSILMGTFERLKEQLEDASADGTQRLYRMKEADGRDYWVRLSLTSTENTVLGVAVDVTQEILEKKKLEHERDFDLLTNIYNRRAFQTRALAIFADPAAFKVGALVMIDLDNLKFVNDTYGHDYGDEYIRLAAHVLRESSGPNVLVSRLSGDEFTVLLHGFDSKEEARAVFDRLWGGMVGRKVSLPGRATVTLRASAGVAWYPEDSASLDELMRFADFAMYQVKHTQKGESTEFSSEHYNREAYLLHCREELNTILDNYLVDYWFQPIVSAADGSILGYEALMRPRSENLRSPAELVALARSQSKLYQVECMTLNRALESFAQLPSSMTEARKLFVNSIPNQILRPADLEPFIARFSSWFPQMVVELTEEDRPELSAIRDRKSFVENWGGGLAIDDFGSGHHGESVLLELQPNYVKVDITIVRNVHLDPDRFEILQGLVKYAHERDILVIAEGVECWEEMDRLMDAEVDYFQGYYFSRPTPIPPEELPERAEEIRQCRARKAQQGGTNR